MGIMQNLKKRIPASSPLPSMSAQPEKEPRKNSRLTLFSRRIRLKGNSSISIPLGAVLLFPLVVIILILVLIVRHPSSAGGTWMPPGKPPSIRKISEKYDKVFHVGCLDPEEEAKGDRENAAFVVLARNKELEGVIQSIKSIERHFNRWFHYPYIFLNDGDFNSTFQETVANYTSAPVQFGKIDPEHWDWPEWVDREVAVEGVRKQGDAAIMYGGLESYHHMCRFYSGYFYKHELLKDLDWYWRLEPEIKYFCDITYDPFKKMAEANKTYGFTIALKELKETVPNMFRYASAYRRVNNLTSQGLWEMFLENEPDKTKKEDKEEESEPDEIDGIVTGPLPEIDGEAMEGEVYNMCHFWSNFEIARLDWFRSKEYNEFFEMMDRSGGFWME